MKSVAILGPTASGKSGLAIALAKRFGGVILSLDSLSIYQEIDIASAKPTLQEREGIVHFGIDVIPPSEPFNVVRFFELYHEAFAYAKIHQAPLLIVGGSGFYLKAMLSGISAKPDLPLHVKTQIATDLLDLPKVYALMQTHDPKAAQKIAPQDRYRIEKWLEFFYMYAMPPSQAQTEQMQMPCIASIPLFEIDAPKEILANKIHERTRLMLDAGLIEEVFTLEKRYTRAPTCMKAIGIVEVLDYFDGRYSLAKLEEAIITHTMQLAKRQRTFNKTQFPPHPKAPLQTLEAMIEAHLKEL